MAIAVPLIVPAARIVLALAARTAVRAAFSKIASDIQTLFNDGPPDSVRQCKAEQKDKTQSGNASGGPEQDPEDEGRKKNAKSPSESPVWKKLKNYRGNIKFNGLSGKETRYYQWDYTHNDIEMYDRQGMHMGSVDPVSGEIYKGAVSGRVLGL